MKQILFILSLLISGTVYGLVSEGDAQVITIRRDADQALQFKVSGGKSFPDVDSCAKYCYQISWFGNQNAKWANLVNIEVEIQLSAEDRQYIADRFVANNVYPQEITWIHNGEKKKIVYKPDDKSLREKRELK